MSRRAVYALLAVFITSIGLAVANVAYTNHVQQESERRNENRAREICGLIRVTDDAYIQTPPTTAVGKNLAAEVHAYRVKLGC